MNTRSTSQLSACPDLSQLVELVAGRLADQEAESISLHVADCDTCDERLHDIEEQSDTLLHALAAMPANDEDEESFRIIQAQLLADPQPFSTRSGDSMTATELREFVADDSVVSIESSLPFQLGNYELAELIGAGAHGAVFRAKHLRLEREVAVKLLMRTDGHHLREFLNEMRIVGQLDHPHIIRATDAGEVEGIHFLAMEYIPGIDVTSLLRRSGPLRVADACEIARQTALGLACAHEHQLVHRDVKTSNLLFSSNGVVKLLDLGLATIPVSSNGSIHGSSDGERSTMEGPRGTADYMAPEQWRAASRVTGQADLYSLGCTLYKLLTGSPPFRTLPSGVTSKQEAHESAEPPPLANLCGDIPKGLDRLVTRLLAKSASERPVSADDVARQLRRYADAADLPRLVRRHCPELQSLPTPAHLKPNSNLDAFRRLTSRVSRRTWLGGAAMLTTASTLLFATRMPRPAKINTKDWRDLLSSRVHAIKLDDAAARPEFTRLADDRQVKITEKGLALVQLGSPLLRPFQWRTNLQRQIDSGSSPQNGKDVGIFFGLKKTAEDGIQFQTLEIRREPDTSRLVWIEYSQPDHFATPLFLAEVVIADSNPNDLCLEVSLGKSSFPEFSLDGMKIPQSHWRFGTEARNLVSKNIQQLTGHYAGRIGVIHHNGITTIKSSQLLYLES